MKSDFAESFRQSFVDFGEARPHGVTTESELAESCGKFTVEIGEAGPKESKVHRGADRGRARRTVSRRHC